MKLSNKLKQIVEFSGVLCAGLFLILSQQACSSKDKDELKEVTFDEALTTDKPESVLFLESLELYQNGLYSVAKESFSTFRAAYPLSPYAEFADLKIADSLFYSREYDAAALAYESFIKDHPRSAIVPYATLSAGRSYQQANRGAGRDVTTLEKARGFYQTVITNFSDTPYRQSAEFHLQKVETDLAEHEQLVMDFYERIELEPALEKRRVAYNQNWAKKLTEPVKPLGNGESIEETDDRIARADQESQQLEGRAEAQAIAKADLEEPAADLENQTGAELVEDAEIPAAPQIIATQRETGTLASLKLSNPTATPAKIKSVETVKDAQPIKTAVSEPVPPSVIAPKLPKIAPIPAMDGNQLHRSGSMLLLRVNCRVDEDSSKITLFFDESERTKNQLELIARMATLESKDDQVKLSLEELDADIRSYRCLGNESLTVRENGDVIIESSEDFNLILLQNPRRLLLYK